MSTPDVDRELVGLVDIYRTEAAENLATMEQSLLALERENRASPEHVSEALRAAHTLKGNSAMLAFEAVTQTAHALEDRFEQMRDGVLPFTTDLITQLLEAVDGLRAQVHAALEGSGTAEPARTERNETAPASGGTLRVAVRRLDTLLDLTGEIAIARGRLVQAVGHAGGDSTLSAALWQVELLHEALQEEVMRLRMVPLGPMLRAHHRTVRDIATKRGRQAALVIEGQDVEVDTSIFEQLKDPLTHMIRNAVDHGIEPPAERRQQGKSGRGTITLRAAHQAGAVRIDVEDDGRGLDRAKIAARGLALGLISDADGLSDEQLFALVLEPGFSTAEEVTDVSGRGVGMDVVARHIRSLRGTIEIRCSPGQGTRFTMRLPLTVAIIDGFAVGVGSERYVLPLEAVDECLEFTGARGAATEGVLELRGSPLPWAHLSALLGAPPTSPARAHVVVLRHAERRIGLVVDALDGDCQAVIKPLSGMLQRLPGVTGSTILGDGRVALILDVPQLVELAMRTTRVAA